jgi:hypothetical protein
MSSLFVPAMAPQGLLVHVILASCATRVRSNASWRVPACASAVELGWYPSCRDRLYSLSPIDGLSGPDRDPRVGAASGSDALLLLAWRPPYLAPPKTDAGYRTVPVPDRVLAAVTQHFMNVAAGRRLVRRLPSAVSRPGAAAMPAGRPGRRH